MKGTVQIKIKYKEIIETMIDKKDSRILVIAVLSEANPDGFIDKVFKFEDWRKTAEIRDFFIEEKKVKQIESEKAIFEKFLQSCEQEVTEWMSAWLYSIIW